MACCDVFRLLRRRIFLQSHRLQYPHVQQLNDGQKDDLCWLLHLLEIRPEGKGYAALWLSRATLEVLDALMTLNIPLIPASISGTGTALPACFRA